MRHLQALVGNLFCFEDKERRQQVEGVHEGLVALALSVAQHRLDFALQVRHIRPTFSCFSVAASASVKMPPRQLSVFCVYLIE